jgi:hypothetical protein
MNNEILKCTNPGCGKGYKENENNNGACIYHAGNPIFHDVKKGWTCCNQIVYDWEEFTALKGCIIGPHSNIKKDNTFFKSNAVNNAQKGLDNTQLNNTQGNEINQEKILSIEEYENEQRLKEEERKRKELEKPKEIVVK